MSNASGRDPASARLSFSQKEIRKQLDRLVDEVTRTLAADRHEGADRSRPTWVPPAEFVRLVRPYLGWN